MDKQQYCYCPKCEGLFKFSSERMAFSDGLVRCSKCSEIFNAKATLLEKTETGFIPVLIQSIDKQQYVENSQWPENLSSGSLEDDESQDEVYRDEFTTDMFSGEGGDQRLSFAFVEKGAGTDDQSFSDDDNDRVDSDINLFIEDKESETTQSGEVKSAGFASLNHDAHNLIKDQSSPLLSLLWGLIIIVLVFLLGLQIRLFAVQKYAQNEVYRGYLELFCNVAQCTLPARQDISLINITNTRINPHLVYPHGVQVLIKLINVAEFAQPYPMLKLTLTDSGGQVVGRRVFAANEYVESGHELLQSNHLTSVHLNLAQPHEKAVGFAVEVVDDGN